MEYHFIDIETATLPVFELIWWIQRGDMDFLVKNGKWSKVKMSKLIESIILDIPIPPIYISEEELYSYIIIDGQKRLNTLFMYMNNEFRLTGLTMLHEFEDYVFKNLPMHIQRKITGYEFQIYIIRKFCNPIVKFEILERMNDQLINLKIQALRSRIYPDCMLFVNELMKNQYLQYLTQGLKEKVQIKQLLIQEYILRVMTFYWRKEKMFDSNLKLSINDMLESFQSNFFNRFKQMFDYVLKVIYERFGADLLTCFAGKKKFSFLLLDILSYSLIGFSDGVTDKIDSKYIRQLVDYNPRFKKYIHSSNITSEKLRYCYTVLTSFDDRGL